MAKRSRENNDMTSDNDDSNEDMAPTTKYTQLEADGETLPTVKITCSLPPHVDNIPFSSYEAYEAHYRANHVNRCSECHKVLPTEHFLALHIAENHDPMNEAKRARGEKTYACFVEGCDKICANSQKRRMHLVDKHMFPKNYDFFIVNAGMENRDSMLRSNDKRSNRTPLDAFGTQRRAIHQGESQLHTRLGSPPKARGTGFDKGRTDQGVENVISAMSALKFLPPSVRFGRGGGRSGFAKE